jgi:hypothetical protein
MTDKENKNSSTQASRRPRKKSQRADSSGTAIDQAAVVPSLNAGPGRLRSLDPDEATLRENIRILGVIASTQGTLTEAAAHLNVSMDTLRDFLDRYPAARDIWEDSRSKSALTVRTQLFKNLVGDKGNRPDPETARWMAERLGLAVDLLKEKELDIKRLELEMRKEEHKREIAVKEEALAQRERAQALREKEFAAKNVFNSSLPIDISLLSLPQLMQFAARIRAHLNQPLEGLTLDALTDETKRTGSKATN